LSDLLAKRISGDAHIGTVRTAQRPYAKAAKLACTRRTSSFVKKGNVSKLNLALFQRCGNLTILYGSGSGTDISKVKIVVPVLVATTQYGYGYASQKVPVPTVPVLLSQRFSILKDLDQHHRVHH
jgi:hypothetical protein